MEENQDGSVCTPDGCGSEAHHPAPAAKVTGAAAGHIAIVSDAICPWCYIGKRRLEKALAMLAPFHSFTVTWHPFELNPDMPREGMERRVYRARKFGSDDHARMLDAQLTEAAALEGLVFRFDRIARTPNTRMAHRLIRYAGEIGASQDALMEAVFRAYFTQGHDIGAAAVLEDAALSCGLDAGRVRDFLASDDGTREVVAEEIAAQRAGVTGVPAFALDGRILFAGAQPSERMAAAIRTAHEATPRQRN